MPADRTDALTYANEAVTRSVRFAHSPAVIRDRKPDLVASPLEVAMAFDRDGNSHGLGMAQCVAQSLLDDTADRCPDVCTKQWLKLNDAAIFKPPIIKKIKLLLKPFKKKFFFLTLA